MKLCQGKIISVLIFGVLFVAVGDFGEGQAGQILAASCSYGDVNAAVSSASPGDTVKIPPCGSAAAPIIWDSGTVDVNGISVYGAGTRDNPATFLKIGTGQQTLFNVINDATYNSRLSGISIDLNPREIYGYPHYAVSVAAGAGNKRARIDNMTFKGNAYRGFHGIMIKPGGLALIDHCKFTNIRMSAIVAFGLGSTSWSTASTMGNDPKAELWNNFYEDNVFICETSAPGYGPDSDCMTAYDMYDGARVVSRYNMFIDASATSHEMKHGARHYEFYQDTFLCNPVYRNNPYCPNVSRYIWLRGGTGIIAQNKFGARDNAYHSSSVQLTCEAADSTRLGSCCNSYPCSGQIGRGLDGTSSEPLYYWGNTDETTGGLQIRPYTNPSQCTYSSTSMIGLGRDYLVGISKPGWTAYPYPHPLSAGLIAPKNLRVAEY